MNNGELNSLESTERSDRPFGRRGSYCSPLRSASSTALQRLEVHPEQQSHQDCAKGTTSTTGLSLLTEVHQLSQTLK